ncbi:hypothetical protein FOZ61_000005 [Perkinsus olseni]|uniref:Uncharacterized protein n=1 Tax=Perkinsus olseni TaxID=32597 RepID=A0A7J6MJL9_PEROL|nr:hypothetical protein FOZ61_000005 [Perkinsus olseni]KAF4676317.1 hypothetical protein FOL46_004918 [Perkinsus olseni]
MLRALLYYLMIGVAVADQRPHGAYCGSYKELVRNGRITIDDDTHFDIYLEVFVEEVDCRREEYQYDPESHTVQLPHWQDPEDCINKKLNAFGVKLDSIVLNYDSGSDKLTLEINHKIKTTMEQCGEVGDKHEGDWPDLGLEVFPITFSRRRALCGKFCGNATGITGTKICVTVIFLVP